VPPSVLVRTRRVVSPTVTSSPRSTTTQDTGVCGPSPTVISAAAGPAQSVSAEDLEQVYNYLARDLRTYRLSEILQEVLESFPGSRTYAAMRGALDASIRHLRQTGKEPAPQTQGAFETFTAAGPVLEVRAG